MSQDDDDATPFVLICAYLEDKGYRRHEILNLSRRYVRRVIGWPRDKDGSLVEPRAKEAQSQPPLDPADQLRRAYWLRGYPAHRIEALVRERMAGQEG